MKAKNNSEMHVHCCSFCGFPVTDWSKHLFCDEIGATYANQNTQEQKKIEEWFRRGLKLPHIYQGF